MARTRIFTGGVIPLIALLGALGTTAPIAYADLAADNTFTAALNSKGIHFASPQAAIIAGHEVCDELGLGRTQVQVATDVTKNSNLDGYHAGYFVGLSVATYCPQRAS
ncbi:DUF732 domain-containing protein [Mycobacterium conspicuum]|jgi:hypothetical protein|nr:DUF732 domain-containing protein [Mycobacterium conspicuum]ORV46254.1 hypothetical protein AWC00_04855 [Mycobacterium conspicuum]